MGAETHVPSLAGEEITIRLLQELQESADAHAREFQDRLKLLTHHVELEFEVDLRAHAAHAKAHEVGALEEEIRVLRESLSASREEIGKLEAKIQELKVQSASHHRKPATAPHTLGGGATPAHRLDELCCRKHEPRRRGRPERIPALSPEGKSGKCGAATPRRGGKPTTARRPIARILAPFTRNAP